MTRHTQTAQGKPVKTPERPITPHKGGRTARIPSGRIRPEVLRDLKELLAAQGQSFADWLEETVRQQQHP